MTILAIDTAGAVASCALVEDKETVAYAQKDTKLNHSETILPLVEHILSERGITLRDVSVFAVTQGPGSFTGLRIGMGAVKGFAFALDRPMAGVSSLASAAYGAVHDGYICSTIKAREDEYFYALFKRENGVLSRVTEDKIDNIDIIKERMSTYSAVCYVSENNARNTALIVANAAELAQIGTAHDINPVYLRLSQAERMLAEKKL